MKKVLWGLVALGATGLAALVVVAADRKGLPERYREAEGADFPIEDERG